LCVRGQPCYSSRGPRRPATGRNYRLLFMVTNFHTPLRPFVAVWQRLSANTQNANQHDEDNTMSLPRSDYDPRRVCVNPFPFLNNVNLGKHRRAFGVYVAGGLVSLLSVPYPLYPLTPSFALPCSPSLLLESGHSSMLLSSLRTRTHHITSQITRYPCTSPSQIGSPDYARSSAFSS
jgi:hypothetical protein